MLRKISQKSGHSIEHGYSIKHLWTFAAASYWKIYLVGNLTDSDTGENLFLVQRDSPIRLCNDMNLTELQTK